MPNPFATDGMAAGYARWRPPVHPKVLERAGVRGSRALDVGCGSGISTRALQGVADVCLGLEPALGMLRWAGEAAPNAVFVAGRAEALPFRDASFDLIAAAGSLNYADPDRFFPEARRVLAPDGVLVAYDFSAGRSFRDTPALDEWFAEFMRRYPPPESEARALDPEVLAGLAAGFQVGGWERFEIGISLTPEFYLDYMLTETNVAAAERRGVPAGEIREWCAESLAPVWRGRGREVLFRGYWVVLNRWHKKQNPGEAMPSPGPRRSGLTLY